MRSIIAVVIIAVVICGAVLGPTGEVLAESFTRGNANRDDSIDISDAIKLLLRLFAAGEELQCLDAADADDDGKITVNDPVTILNYVFSSAEIPAPGASGYGPDPTPDALDCADSGEVMPPVLLSELQYHPWSSFADREFVELYNRMQFPVDISGYHFSAGISYTFPEGSVIPADGFVIVAKNLKAYERSFKEGLFGPFEGRLDNGGERVTLANEHGVIDTVRYDDRFPWPLAPDGYGPSLERIDFTTPGDDLHVWRTAGNRKATPISVNDGLGIPTYPLLTSTTFTPEHPMSSDAVSVTMTLDVEPSEIQRAVLQWEVVQTSVADVETSDMQILAGGDVGETVLRSTIPAQPSQHLVRFNLHLTLADGTTTFFPHEVDEKPFTAYFVYDGEISHSLPVLWLFRSALSKLVEIRLAASGAAILEVGSDTPHVFGRAGTSGSQARKKVRFIKGNEYRDDRTINVMEESPTGGTNAGPIAPFMEHLGFQTFRDLGALAPRVDWFRVISFQVGETPLHTQNIVVQQVNERFFEMNGLSGDADIYKNDKESIAKKNNFETGLVRQRTLWSRLKNTATRRATLDAEVDLENIGMYSVLGMLIENWDGFHNNLFLYDDPNSEEKWKLIPWDLDQCMQEQYYQIPVNFPLTGSFPGGPSRNPGVITGAFHKEPDLDATYRSVLRAHVQPGGPFTTETMEPKISALEDLLLADLELQEAYMGEPRDGRRKQITDSYASIRRYIELRVNFLREQLGTDAQ